MATSHTIRLELGPAGAPPEVPDDHEQLLDALAGYSPALGVTDVGRLEVIVSLPADTVGQAVTTALALVAQADRGEVVAVEATTSEEFDRRVELPILPKLLSATEAAEQLGMTRQSVHERIQAGTLPAARVGKTYAVLAAAVAAAAPRRRTVAQMARDSANGGGEVTTVADVALQHTEAKGGRRTIADLAREHGEL